MNDLFLIQRHHLMLEDFGGSLPPNRSPASIEAERDDARIKPRSPSSSRPSPSKKVTKDENKFPVLLFRMLQSESASSADDHDHDVVSWSPKGTSFMIRKTEAFTERILPRYFGGTATKKYRSFQRQLNLYGFRGDSSASIGCWCSNYHHPKFVRDHPELVAGIQRKQQTKNKNTNKQQQVQVQVQSPPPKNVSARKKQLTTIKEQQAEARRRMSLNTLASETEAAAVVVASSLAAKSISNNKQAEPPPTTTNKPPRRRRKSSSSTKQKADTTLEDVCDILLLPQEHQRQDQDARQSLDEAFRVFIQEEEEEDDDSWDLVQE
jgi:hypothetical protein